MATEIFLNLNDKAITGESIRDGHTDEIDVVSFSFDVHHVGQKEGTGEKMTHGKAEFGDVQIAKHVDKASPKLMEACAAGTHYTKAVLTMRSTSSNTDKVDFYVVSFGDLIISSFNNSGASENDQLVEHITISYSRVNFKYTVQKKDGTSGGSVEGKWNVKTNKNAFE